MLIVHHLPLQGEWQVSNHDNIIFTKSTPTHSSLLSDFFSRAVFALIVCSTPSSVLFPIIICSANWLLNNTLIFFSYSSSDLLPDYLCVVPQSLLPASLLARRVIMFSSLSVCVCVSVCLFWYQNISRTDWDTLTKFIWEYCRWIFRAQDILGKFWQKLTEGWWINCKKIAEWKA